MPGEAGPRLHSEYDRSDVLIGILFWVNTSETERLVVMRRRAIF